MPIIKLSPVVKKARSHKILALIIVLVLIVAALFAWNRYSTWQNKRDFAQARKNIDTLYGLIVAQVGPPDNFKRVNECSRPNMEFQQGPLSCDISTAFIYPVADLNEANAKFKQIQHIVAGRPDLFKNTAPLSRPLEARLVVNDTYYTANDSYLTADRLKCGIQYVFNTPREIDLTLNKQGYPFEVYLSCFGGAKNSYYPAKN